VVEDNVKVGRFISKGLAENGFAVDVAPSAADAERLAVATQYDVIILDRMLPDQDGLQTLSLLRHRGIATPILVLSVLGSTVDKVNGLERGADDYLAKPFEFSELLARVRALLRRGRPQDGACLRYADLSMDLLSREVARGDARVKLTPREFAILEYFLRNPQRVLSRALLGEHVWGMDFDPDSNVVDVYVASLRRKLERDGGPRILQTVIGAGYVLRDPPNDANGHGGRRST
jgi:DNA-binding response OmpR family regulator